MASTTTSTTTSAVNTSDLSVFADPTFDAKAWINGACAGRTQEEPLDRFLAELEMRLQLGSEEVEQSLTEISTAALRRVPFAQQEVSRLKGDVRALQAAARSLLTTVAVDAEAAAAAAAPLAALHTARTNMEAGCATLREAAELSGAFRRVEEVFAAGDLPRVADMLRSMARSLALVGDVPEFREGKGKLAALEDRLQRRVEGRLGEALQANNSSEVASLSSLLLAVGRYNSLEAAYIASRLPLISAMWDEAAAMLASGGSSQQPAAAAAAAAAAGGASAGGLAGGWLLLLYNNLVGLLEGDAAWLAGCLEQQRQQLLVALIGSAFDKLNKSIAAKLSAVNTTRLLGSIMGDFQQAARRLRELLSSILAAAAAAAATAAGGGSSGAAAVGGAAGGGGGGDAAAAGGLLKHGSSSAAAVAASAGGAGSGEGGGKGGGSTVAAAAVKTEVKLLGLLLDPLETQVSKYMQLEEPVYAAQFSAPLPVPTTSSSSSSSRPQQHHQHLQQQPQAAMQQQQQQEEEDLESDVALKLDAACMGVFQCLAGVLERCVLLTGGTELPQLQSVFDKQVAGYLQRLLAAVGIINARYTRLAASGSPTADVSMMLQLILLARSVTNRLNALETQLRSNLATAIPRLQGLAAAGLPPPAISHHHHGGHSSSHHLQPPQQQGPAGGVSSAAATAGGGGGGGGAAAVAGGVTPAAAAAAAELLPLRVAAFPGKLQPLERVRQATVSSRFMSLPSAHAAGAALVESITNAVYEALMSPVMSNLRGLPQLREWTAAAPGAAGGVVTGAGASVPTFNAYPLPTVTAVGEYLMALPQQLEVLMGPSAAAAGGGGSGSGGDVASSEQQQQQSQGDVDEEEGDELAAEWLDKVVRGAGGAYAETILHIPHLSPAGAAQLAADSEYFCNVMSALAVGPPPELITVQLFAGVPAESWEGLAAGAVAGGSADVKVLRALSAMRGLNWSSTGSEGGAAAPTAAASTEPAV